MSTLGAKNAPKMGPPMDGYSVWTASFLYVVGFNISSGDVDWVWAFGGVGLVAAPLPFTGLCDKSSCDRVAVDVAELFYAFSVAEDVEVVVAGLPDVVFRAGAGESLLENLNGQRQRSGFGLRDQKVDVVRHDDVAVDVE
jgi:hypothetical protein